MFEAFGGERASISAGRSEPVPCLSSGPRCRRPVGNLDYVDGVTYANLWEGACVRLPDLQHAPFLGGAGAFNPILERFLRDVSRSAGRSAE